LGKDLSEIRSMPYPEWRSWFIYSLVEPFDWHEDEYRTATIVTAIHNSNEPKRAKKKDPIDFMRDLSKHILNRFAKIKAEDEMEDEYEQMSPEQKRKFAIQRAREVFGIKG